jgi:hypothetical protein
MIGACMRQKTVGRRMISKVWMLQWGQQQVAWSRYHDWDKCAEHLWMGGRQCLVRHQITVLFKMKQWMFICIYVTVLGQCLFVRSILLSLYPFCCRHAKGTHVNATLSDCELCPAGHFCSMPCMACSFCMWLAQREFLSSSCSLMWMISTLENLHLP